jgi:hypothetical protein
VDFEIETYSNVTKAQVQKELETIAEEFQSDKPDLTFIVALNLENAVRRFVPYETGVEYTANRGYDIVLGKTIPLLENGHLRFVIILDANIFKDMSPASSLRRWEVIVHELCHVRIDLSRFRATGTLVAFTTPHSKMEIAKRNGEILWEEYAVERSVANWKVTVTAESKFQYNMAVLFGDAIGFADDVLRDLQSYETILREAVIGFRDPETDMTSLTRSVTGTIWDILLRLAKIYANAEVSANVRSKASEIERNSVFIKYFAYCWSRILSLLREYYADHTTSYRLDIIDNIARAYDDVFQRSGVHIEDNASGFSVRMT